MGGDRAMVAEGWIDTREAAEVTGYTVRYLQRLARDSKVEAVKLGRDWFFNRESVVSWRERMDALDTKKHRPTGQVVQEAQG